MPAYGTGKEAGNEAGYIVGMSTCYPQPGSVKINDREILVLESNYSGSQNHTGVMGLFYLLVARDLPKSMPDLPFAVQVRLPLNGAFLSEMICKVLKTEAGDGVAVMGKLVSVRVGCSLMLRDKGDREVVIEWSISYISLRMRKANSAINSRYLT